MLRTLGETKRCQTPEVKLGQIFELGRRELGNCSHLFSKRLERGSSLWRPYLRCRRAADVTVLFNTMNLLALLPSGGHSQVRLIFLARVPDVGLRNGCYSFALRQKNWSESKLVTAQREHDVTITSFARRNIHDHNIQNHNATNFMHKFCFSMLN